MTYIKHITVYTQARSRRQTFEKGDANLRNIRTGVRLYLSLSIYTATDPREDFVQEHLRVKAFRKVF